MDSLPEQYRKPIKAITQRMREFMAKGMQLEPFVFLGQGDKNFLPIPMRAGNVQEKNMSAAMVQAIAKQLNPDYVLMISEGWTLPESIPNEEQMKLVKEYGSIEGCPQREEIVFATLETLNGIWVARQPILQLSGKSRGFEDFKFRLMDCVSGRFTSFLSPASRTMH